MAQDLQEKFTPQQELYLEYLAAGKQDVHGNKYSKGDMAKLFGTDPATLWRWERLPGFQEEVFNRSMARLTEYLPSMNKAMVKKALDKGDVQAYMAIMRQANLLKADKFDNKNDNTDNVTIRFDA